jgi:hypothetical protein
MTYRSPSAIKKDPSVALSHAAASFRVTATAASCSRPLMRTMFWSASNSASVSEMARKYFCRALGLSVHKCARRMTAVSVSSVEGTGIPPPPTLSGSAGSADMILLSEGRPIRRRNRIAHGQASPRKGKSAALQTVNHFDHNGRNRPISGTALCCAVLGGDPSQGARNLVRLQEGLGFTSPGSLRKPVCPPIHHLPCREIHGDDLGHSFALKSVPVPVRPLLVSL